MLLSLRTLVLCKGARWPAQTFHFFVNSSAGAGNTNKGLAHAKPYRRVRVTSDQTKVVQGERGLHANNTIPRKGLRPFL